MPLIQLTEFEIHFMRSSNKSVLSWAGLCGTVLEYFLLVLFLHKNVVTLIRISDGSHNMSEMALMRVTTYVCFLCGNSYLPVCGYHASTNFKQRVVDSSGYLHFYRKYMQKSYGNQPITQIYKAFEVWQSTNQVIYSVLQQTLLSCVQRICHLIPQVSLV